jgi:hypothetical protein
MKQLTNISVEQIINIIPDELLDQLSVQGKVNYSVKKLTGKIIFKLLLYSLLSVKNISLRIIEAIYNSDKFKNLFNLSNDKIKHSGLGFRISTIDYTYFENIFKHLIQSAQVNEIIFANKKILARKIDSTIVNLSSKLLKVGMDDNPGLKTLKFSVEINQGIPVNIMMFKDQKYLSESNALPEIIHKKSCKNGLNIAIFDRGVSGKKTFAGFNQANIYFISRTTNHKLEVLEELPLTENSTDSLNIISHQKIKLTNLSNDIKAEDNIFYAITGLRKETKEKIVFITNVDFLSVVEITELYRSRWEIETFFKFIKQELNFKHLLSRTENGIKVVMYMTMITAILLTIYKKTNNIMGLAVAKIKFINELEKDLMNNWHTEITPAFVENHPLLANVGGT